MFRSPLESTFDTFVTAVDHLVEVHPSRAKKYILRMDADMKETEMWSALRDRNLEGDHT